MRALLLLICLLSASAFADDTMNMPAATTGTAAPPPPAMGQPPAGAKVFFTAPATGSKVGTKLHVTMGVAGMTVQPAGEIKDGTGHHHIIIDGQPVPAGEVVPKDDTHLHFGNGATEADLTLTPGTHTLTLQFADGIHRSYGPAMSSTITVTVQ